MNKAFIPNKFVRQRHHSVDSEIISDILETLDIPLSSHVQYFKAMYRRPRVWERVASNMSVQTLHQGESDWIFIPDLDDLKVCEGASLSITFIKCS